MIELSWGTIPQQTQQKMWKELLTFLINIRQTVRDLRGKPMFKLKNQNLLRETWPKVVWLSTIYISVVLSAYRQQDNTDLALRLCFFSNPFFLHLFISRMSDLRRQVNLICGYLFIFQNVFNIYVSVLLGDELNGRSMPIFILYFVLNMFIYFAQKRLEINMLNLALKLILQSIMNLDSWFIIFQFFAFIFVIMEREITMLKIALLVNFQKQILHTLPMGCLIYGKGNKLLYANRTIEEQIFLNKVNDKKDFDRSSGKRQSSFLMDYEGKSEIERKIQKFLQKLIITPEDKRSPLRQQDEFVNFWTNFQALPKTEKLKKQYKYFCVQQQFQSHSSLSDIIHKDKFYFEILINTAINYDSQSCYMITLYDISTDYKSTVFQQMNTFKSRLLKSISHELRTRLNIVQGILEILQHRNLQLPDHTNVIYAYNNCRIQSYIVGSIVDYNLIREGRIRLNQSICDVRNLLYDLKSLFLEECLMKNINIHISIKYCSSYELKTDQTKLMQVLVNIMSNAVKFTEQTGYIEISLSQNAFLPVDEYKKLYDRTKDTSSLTQGIENQLMEMKEYQVVDQVQSHDNSQYFVITFKDSGIGIDTDKMKLIDEILEHDDLGHDPLDIDKSQGFMLGLRSSAKTLEFLNMNKQKNTLKVISYPSLGTTVSIVIFGINNDEVVQRSPKKPTMKKTVKIIDQRIDIDLEESEPVLQVGNYTSPVYQFRTKDYFIRKRDSCSCRKDVMIVDDEPFNLVILEAMLKLHGQKVQKANDGFEFINMFKKRIFQCMNERCTVYKFVIMDFQMPRLNGAEATRQALQICRRQKRQDVIIIGCTAFSSPEDIRELKEAGMKYICLKPITNPKIGELIQFVETGQVPNF